MIHYALRCHSGHSFDGWFAGSSAFSHQIASGLVECPNCGSCDIVKALMAPAIGRRSGAAPADAPDQNKQAPVRTDISVPTARAPAELISSLQKLRRAVETSCEYVGTRFAEHVIQMHAGKNEMRAIYGETTATEADMLRSEGIEVTHIPWVDPADS